MGVAILDFDDVAEITQVDNLFGENDLQVYRSPENY